MQIYGESLERAFDSKRLPTPSLLSAATPDPEPCRHSSRSSTGKRTFNGCERTTTMDDTSLSGLILTSGKGCPRSDWPVVRVARRSSCARHGRRARLGGSAGVREPGWTELVRQRDQSMTPRQPRSGHRNFLNFAFFKCPQATQGALVRSALFGGLRQVAEDCLHLVLRVCPFSTTLSCCRNCPVRRPFVLRVVNFARLSKTLSNSATPGPSPIVNLTK